MILKKCSSCLVYTAKGSRLSEAKVVHTGDQVTLYFPHYHMRDARFKAQVDFYDEFSGLIRAACELVIHRNPKYPEMVEPWMADCVIFSVNDVIQRQQDVRVKVNLELMFTLTDHGEFFGTILNLSAGGMQILTKQPLDRNDKISFSYSFKTLERRFEAIVRWVKRVDGGQFRYGCQFINLTDGAESAIRKYVYKKQLELRKGES